MENIIDLHRRSVTGLRPVLDRVTPADLGRPTPCAGWDLRALLEHMAGQDRGFAAAVRAARAGDDVDVSAFAPHPLGPSPAATIADGLDDVVAAFAAGADGLVLMPEFDRRLPLPVLVQMHLIDTLVHGWDVAATLGVQADYGSRLDADVVAAALAMSEQIPDDEYRETPGATFAHALPAPQDAGPWTRVLTLLGRDPAWTSDPLVRR
ncbi:uncharacterized protein (TIGR03086 family) [Pseudonocardia hierapolitana]|uniref:Uncharacterized protein (TIGR03086 family) n=1 Tax=Pseudonocardia hierapolitana TaxID=1128676 RepID=A0A561T1I0_9PSEU|nr:TIGR03086 family metal-binding protein [Pseudonocardia hierapolitana]TWF80973.1 uncharacterized protein (TIGR03086 family) [Pseudonocardia hierapolitana]